MRNSTCGPARSRRPLVAAAAAAALAASLACASPSPPSSDPPVALVDRGSVLFEDHCALCHGATGQGDGAFAPELMTPAADLTHISLRRGGTFPAGEVARFIDGRIPVEAHRSPEMPVWGRVISVEVADPGIREEVTRGKISALAAYLQSIQIE